MPDSPQVPLLLRIDIGPGELIDRLAIMGLKASRAKTAALRDAASQRHDALMAQRAQLPEDDTLADLEARLVALNTALWEAEDDIRALISARDGGTDFVDLARRIAKLNDARAEAKGHIDAIFGWPSTDVKSYDVED